MNGEQFSLNPLVSVGCQLRTIAAIERQIGIAANSGVRPVIEIDLDLCALRPVYRTTRALQQVAEEFGICEFDDPSRLESLPGYSDEAWDAFLKATDIEAQYPQWKWRENGRPIRTADSPFGRFHHLFWTASWMNEDEPTPGLGSFVHHIEFLGGCCVFLSGRWEEEHIEPSLEALKRAGIPQPHLVLGNPWHETKSSSVTDVLSDSAVKSWRQEFIQKRYGTPVAIIDDRITNRTAVVQELAGPMLSIAIAIPGFTCDEESMDVPLRISTFERFCQTVDSPPVRPFMRSRYEFLGYGQPWNGEYSGLGKNGLGYALPRPANPITIPSAPPFRDCLGMQRNVLSEEQALQLFESTIPGDEQVVLRKAFGEANRLAEMGLAAPWGESAQRSDDSFDRNIWRSLVSAWLHSRDMETLMKALGFDRVLTGNHDLRETVHRDEITHLLLSTSPVDQERLKRAQYSPWLIAWAKQIEEEHVNVSFLNPHLLLDLCQWSPVRTTSQDAMDVHRLSDHHDGDGLERYDPIEAGINNLLHQREGRFGVRKEPSVPWPTLRIETGTENGACDVAKNSAARFAIRDAIDLAEKLEQEGWMTPWFLCESRE
jgi:hypothetical protein